MKQIKEAFAKVIMTTSKFIEIESQRDLLLAAARKTLAENSHLADGDDCTLKALRDAVEAIDQARPSSQGAHDNSPAFFRAEYREGEAKAVALIYPADEKRYREKGWELTPLYAAPPAPKPPESGELEGAASQIERKVYRNSSEHIEYLNARFNDKYRGIGISFEWQGHRWAYRYTSFDDTGDYDLIWRPDTQEPQVEPPASADPIKQTEADCQLCGGSGRASSDQIEADRNMLRDRDNAQKWADKLADAIADYFGVYIGEHSNVNNPWGEALGAIPSPPSQAIGDVLAERQRQVEVEGWTAEHDDEHKRGEIALAAACYTAAAANGIGLRAYGNDVGGFPLDAARRIQLATCFQDAAWPWDHKWWKPSTPRRNLVKAGALILAEIERLDRAAENGGAA